MSKRSSSPKQRIANKENTKRSTGARTPEGPKQVNEAISVQKSRTFKDVSFERLIDGITVVGECLGGLELLFDQHIHDFLPQNATEFGIVEEMVKVKWEMERVQIAQTNVINKLAAAATEASPSLKLTAALESAYADKAFLNMQRGIQRFRRDYSNLIATLGKARKLRQNHGTKATKFPGQPDPLDYLDSPIAKFAESNPPNEISINQTDQPTRIPTPETPNSGPPPPVSGDGALIPIQVQSKPDASDQATGPRLPLAA